MESTIRILNTICTIMIIAFFTLLATFAGLIPDIFGIFH